MTDFQWPWQYNFPPFFTLQPHLATREKQLEAWCQLLLAYCKHHRLYILDVNEIQSSPVFYNNGIKRKLDAEAVKEVLEKLQRKGNIEWNNKSKQSCLVMWRTPEEWSKLIYTWISSNGMTNTVCTLYEIINGDDSSNEEFSGLAEEVLLRALQHLEGQNRAELISLPDGSRGVKFF